MKNKLNNHPVTTNALNHAAKLYWSPRWSLGVHTLDTGEMARHECQFRREGERIRCTVIANGMTHLSKWFWQPVKSEVVQEGLPL